MHTVGKGTKHATMLTMIVVVVLVVVVVVVAVVAVMAVVAVAGLAVAVTTNIHQVLQTEVFSNHTKNKSKLDIMSNLAEDGGDQTSNASGPHPNDT